MPGNKQMEELKPVVGYEDSYLISSMGRLWSKRANRFLHPLPTRDGYYRYALCKKGTKTYVFAHRLVAQAFIPNPHQYPQINHIDENKTNNIVNNLEWCELKYNLEYGGRMERISQALKNYPAFSKKVLCVETGVVYASIKDAARLTGLNCQNISAVCHGRVKTAGRCHWKFYEEVT